MGNITRFIEELKNNTEFAEKVDKVSNPEEIIALAADVGIIITAEELPKMEREFRREIEKATEGQMEELSLEELESAAGGQFFEGEEASDGHEMGCYITWYREIHVKKMNEWCQNNYYSSETGKSIQPEKIKWKYGKPGQANE